MANSGREPNSGKETKQNFGRGKSKMKKADLIYLLKVNNRNTRTRFEICSKLTIKTPERRQWRIVNLEHISHLVLMFLLLTLNK